MTLRQFAFWNIWFWGAQHPVTVVWYFIDDRSFGSPAEFYLVQISVAALWLSSLAWWQSTRVEDDALTIDEIVEQTNIEPNT